MSFAGFPPPPEAAVREGRFEFGRFNAPFPRANMLDVERPYHYPVPRFLKDLRLKEWQAFQFGDSRWFLFTALYNAKLFSFATFQAYDRETKARYGFKRILPGGDFRFHDRLARSRVAYRGPRSLIDYDFSLDEGKIRIDIEHAYRKRAARFSGSFAFALGPRLTAPSAVCLPLGMNRAMYSTKVLMPFSGEFRSEEGDYRFDSPAAMGILDDHKGFYPWRLRYDWVTGFGLDAKGRRAGFNLTDNQVKDQERYNENCLWIGSKVWPLPPVRVTRPQGPQGDWIIQDTEGMVDLVFHPEVENDIRFNLGLVESDYHGPFGSFRGLLKNGDGDKIEAERLYGAGEQKYLRA